MTQEETFVFPGSTLLLRKLRVDIKNDPDIIERMVGNMPLNKQQEEELVSSMNMRRAAWMSLAVKSVMAKPSPTTMSSALKQISKPGPKKRKPVDRLKDDKKYLRYLSKQLNKQGDDKVSCSVSNSANETIRFSVGERISGMNLLY